MSDKREEAMLEYADSDFNESEWQKYRVYVEKKYPTLVQSWVVARGMFNAGWNARAGYDAGRSERDWRRVEDGLPTEEGEYLVTINFGYESGPIVTTATFVGPNWVWPLVSEDAPVVAWCEKPEPYQEAL